jgi:hypothetical protein
VEHTLHVLFLPGIHSNHASHTSRAGAFTPAASDSSLDLTARITTAPIQSATQAQPGIPILGSHLSIPSPLHFTFHITTRLDFNDAGRISYHRDLWDVRDVLSLFPGGALAQWLASRVTAQSLSFAYHLGQWMLGRPRNYAPASQVPQEGTSQRAQDRDLEQGEGRSPPSTGMTPAETYARSALRWLSSDSRVGKR